MKIEIQRLRDNAIIPTRANDVDAGYDLYATESVILTPLERKLVCTGIAMSIPPGYYGRIAPRSGLAAKHGIMVNGGVIDASYTGEIKVILVNVNYSQIPSFNTDGLSIYNQMFGEANAYKVRAGDRIAQLIIEKCHDVEWAPVAQLTPTSRGDGGFGSSGK